MTRDRREGVSSMAQVFAQAVLGLALGWSSIALASPEEDEINRLNRVRANLFEELVRTRGEVASVREQLEAALRAREQAEAELVRVQHKLAGPSMPGEKAGVRPAPTDEGLRRLRRLEAGPSRAKEPSSRTRQASTTANTRSVPASRGAPQVRVNKSAAPRLSGPVARRNVGDPSLPNSLRLN